MKDRKYTAVRNLITAGFYKSFRDMFDAETIPKSVVARDLGMNNKRFTKVMYTVEEFRLKDLLRLASFIEIDRRKLIDLVLQQYDIDKNEKV